MSRRIATLTYLARVYLPITEDEFIIDESREEIISTENLISGLQENGITKIYTDSNNVNIETTSEYESRPVREKVLLGALLFDVLARRDVYETSDKPALEFPTELQIGTEQYHRFLDLVEDDELHRVEREGAVSAYQIPTQKYREVLEEFNFEY